MKRDVPEPWAGRMVEMLMVDPRNGRPSMTRLAEAAGVHPSTVSEMMYGTRATSREVVDKVAVALYPPDSTTNASRRHREVHGWVGRALEEATPFQPHPDVDLLDAQEQKAINEMIRLLARSKKGQRRSGLSVVDDNVPDVAAADMQEQPAAGESESYNEP